MKLMTKDTDLFTAKNLKSLKIKNIKINTIKTISKYSREKITKEIVFELEEKKITMFHREDCCEVVFIHKHTNLESLIGKTIVKANEKVSNKSFDKKVENGPYIDDVFSWTFFKFTFNENNCSETSENETSENETSENENETSENENETSENENETSENENETSENENETSENETSENENETSENNESENNESENNENKTVEIIWFGTSNGYYDMGVEFEPSFFPNEKPCIFDNLKGLKITNVTINTILDLNTNQETKEIIFESNNFFKLEDDYKIEHKKITMFQKNCNEKIYLHKYTNLKSLIEKKIIEVRQMSSNETFDETRENQPDVDDVFLWKFYKLICSKEDNCSESETVEIIWFSTSNNDMGIEFKIEES
jgi:hypothetical protein